MKDCCTRRLKSRRSCSASTWVWAPCSSWSSYSSRSCARAPRQPATASTAPRRPCPYCSRACSRAPTRTTCRRRAWRRPTTTRTRGRRSRARRSSTCSTRICSTSRWARRSPCLCRTTSWRSDTATRRTYSKRSYLCAYSRKSASSTCATTSSPMPSRAARRSPPSIQCPTCTFTWYTFLHLQICTCLNQQLESATYFVVVVKTKTEGKNIRVQTRLPAGQAELPERAQPQPASHTELAADCARPVRDAKLSLGREDDSRRHCAQ